MHHLRNYKVVGTVILSPEEQERRLQEEANTSFRAFCNGDKEYDDRLTSLNDALVLAEQARNVRRVR